MLLLLALYLHFGHPVYAKHLMFDHFVCPPVSAFMMQLRQMSSNIQGIRINKGGSQSDKKMVLTRVLNGYFLELSTNNISYFALLPKFISKASISGDRF